MPDTSVKVICRFRPINEREKREQVQAKDGVRLEFTDDSGVSVVTPGSKDPQIYNFDRVFQGDCAQEAVFETAAKPTVDDVLEGYNGTIFAYGQTGSGKSFSMMGPDITSAKMAGIIPRACSLIFDRVDSASNSGIEFNIKCSFLEIYKEVIRDLLDPEKVNLKVRETPTRGVWVDCLSEHTVASQADVMALLRQGEEHRSVASTQMNAQSSRSHSLFIITVTQKLKNGSTKIGKLNLADLAGSEKVGKTGAVGDTLEEAKKINQSLSALGNCIMALTKAKKSHIPYRDSKLTFILRESLGGNAKTTLLIACSPHVFNLEETVSTLRFGQRAKSIKNKVRINQQRSVQELELIIQKLTHDLRVLKTYTTLLEGELKSAKGAGYDMDAMRKQLMHTAHALEAAAAGKRDGGSSSGTDSNDGTPNKNASSSSSNTGSPMLLSPDSGGENRSRRGSEPPFPPSSLFRSPSIRDSPGTPSSGFDSPMGGGSSAPPSPPPELGFDPMEMAELQLAYDHLKEDMTMKIQDLTEELSAAREQMQDKLRESDLEQTRLREALLQEQMETSRMHADNAKLEAQLLELKDKIQTLISLATQAMTSSSLSNANTSSSTAVHQLSAAPATAPSTATSATAASTDGSSPRGTASAQTHHRASNQKPALPATPESDLESESESESESNSFDSGNSAASGASSSSTSTSSSTALSNNSNNSNSSNGGTTRAPSSASPVASLGLSSLGSATGAVTVASISSPRGTTPQSPRAISTITSNDIPTLTAAPIVPPPIRRNRFTSAPLMGSSPSAFGFAVASSAFGGANQSSPLRSTAARSALSFALPSPGGAAALNAAAVSAAAGSGNGSGSSSLSSSPGGAASPAAMAAGGASATNGQAAQRQDDNVEYQLFCWMKLAIKLDLAAHGNLGDDLDKTVLYEQLVRDAVPPNEWPKKIVEALERRAPPRPTASVQSALAPPPSFNR